MINEIVKFLLGLSIVMMISCQPAASEKLDRLDESEIYKGELTFKLISFDSYYALPDTMIQQIELYMDSLKGLANYKIHRRY